MAADYPHGLTKDEVRVFDQAEKSMRDVTWQDDPAVMRLPHPARVAVIPVATPSMMLVTVADPRHQPMVRDLMRQGAGTLAIYQALQAAGDQRIDAFTRMHATSAEHLGGFGSGSAGPTVQGIRFSVAGGRIYSFSDELVELLHRTKLSADVPVEALTLPQANIYIELGTDRSRSPFGLLNQESGLHALEGAYVSSTTDIDGESIFEFTLTGSPVGHRECLDDAVEWVSLRTSGRISLKQALHDAFTKPAHGHVPVDDYFEDQDRLVSKVHEALPKLELIAKCILFIGLDEAIKREVLEVDDARKALARTQSGAHRRRAAKHLARSYDRVQVDAPPTPESGDGDRRTVGTHLRDGHLRHQRHGPGNALIKVIWIRPTWVNAGAIGAS